VKLVKTFEPGGQKPQSVAFPGRGDGEILQGTFPLGQDWRDAQIPFLFGQVAQSRDLAGHQFDTIQAYGHIECQAMRSLLCPNDDL
jgi:hypothetical protein